MDCLEEPSNVSNSAPEIITVSTGPTSDGQVLCSMDDMMAWLKAPQGFQVVAGVAAQDYQAPGNGEQPQMTPVVLSQPLLRPHKLAAPQLGPYPEWGQRQGMDVFVYTPL